jgi:hypothetical protein
MRIVPKIFVKLINLDGERFTVQTDDRGVINNTSKEEENWCIGRNVAEVRYLLTWPFYN